jgi:branched-chain amino acid transport system permease protein
MGLARIAKKRGGIVAMLVVAVLVFLIPAFGTSQYFLSTCILAMIFIIAVSSLRLVAISGQVNMGHAGFMSVGAYVSAVLAKSYPLNPWLTILIGGLVTLGLGFLVGIPFARLRGIYFSMITLFFGAGLLSINQVLDRWTGGYSGMAGIPPLLHVASKVPYYYLFLGITIVCLAIIYRLEYSRLGVTWKAIAQSDLVAASIGVNVQIQRALALGIGCFFAGVAGATFAHYYTLLSHSSFNFLASINMIVYMLTGGLGSFVGPIVGTALLVVIPESLRFLKAYVPFIFAAMVLLVIYVMPNGLTGLPAQILAAVRNRRAPETKREVPDYASRS